MQGSPIPPPIPNFLYGIDAARWQGEIDFAACAAAGIRYAWLKAVHGLGGPDPAFLANWKRSHGHMPRGAYLWLTDSDPIAQAENLVRVVDNAGTDCELTLAVDFEEPGTKMRGAPLVEHLRKCLHRVRTLTGVAPLMYTGAWYWDGYALVDAQDIVEEFPLWHAQYPRTVMQNARACGVLPPDLPDPRLPKPWRDRNVECAVWQFDGNGGCLLPNGVDVDFNRTTPYHLASLFRSARPVQELMSKLDGPATPLRAPEPEHTVRPMQVDLDD